MASTTDWAAIVVLPGQEYVAFSECQRFGLTCFLPQRRTFWRPTGASSPLLRSVPLLKCFLIRMSQARDRAIPHARGICCPRWLLEDGEGKVWLAPDEAVRRLSYLDREGAFDQPGGNAARLDGCELMSAVAGEALAETFRPLFACREKAVQPLNSFSKVSIQAPAWINSARVAAANSRDVLEREERGCDDRPAEVRRAHASKAHAAGVVAQRLDGAHSFRFGARASA